MEGTICPWAKGELYVAYHDKEWGKPLYDDRALFELLILEGMQAGLSWITILKKREAFRAAFDGFAPETVAAYTEEKKLALMENTGIVRNRRKIDAAVTNAKLFLETQKEWGRFARYLWSFVGNKQIVNHWENIGQMPATSEISDRMSADLKKRGFKFVGSTICYSLMQSAGLVNDHLVSCAQYHHCGQVATPF